MEGQYTRIIPSLISLPHPPFHSRTQFSPSRCFFFFWVHIFALLTSPHPFYPLSDLSSPLPPLSHYSCAFLSFLLLIFRPPVASFNYTVLSFTSTHFAACSPIFLLIHVTSLFSPIIFLLLNFILSFLPFLLHSLFANLCYTLVFFHSSTFLTAPPLFPRYSLLLTPLSLFLTASACLITFKAAVSPTQPDRSPSISTGDWPARDTNGRISIP